MLVPIRNRTKVIGILAIHSYALKSYSPHNLKTLQALADHCGGALERIHAEQALRQSEMLFHSVWQNSVDGMRLTDEQGKVIAVNQAFCKLVGMSREELEGQLFTVIYAQPEETGKVLEKYGQRFRERVIEKQVERKLTLKNGSLVIFEDTDSFVELTGQAPLLLGLFRDVTLQKRLEEQLRQSQKMEAIGQLAGGVAHDFNNILTVIHGHASLLMASGTLTGSAGRSATQISQAAERAASLTRQLLTFSRRQVMQPRCLDMNEVVSNMTKMLGRILGEDIALQIHHFSGPALVQADASMMEQVLLNLAVNSRDAMPKGGKLSIRINVLDVDAPHTVQHHEARTGHYVCLLAADTGCGIAAENLRRIFEPFFTTKEIGKGTGLGLATVYGIVKQNQGEIVVESAIGRGSLFRIYFPVVSPVYVPVSAAAEVSAEPANGTVLVVEDEDIVRNVVVKSLRRAGYTVLEAHHGEEALDICNRNAFPIDLILTDVILAGMNGKETAEAVRKNDVKEIRALGKQVMDGFGSTAYGPTAALLLAKTNYENGDPAGAAEQLQWAIDKAKDSETAEVARLRLAAIRLDEKKYDDALRLLEATHSAAMETLYADLRGDVMIAQGKTAEARAAYRMAIDKSLPNSSYRSVVQIKLDALGTDQ